MKRTALAAGALLALTVSVLPPAYADGDGAGAAALGFFLGSILAPTRVVYGAPPTVAYAPPPRVVMRLPGRVYHRYRQASQSGYYRVRHYRYRGWHAQGRRWEGHGDWRAYAHHDRHHEDDD